MSIDTLFVETFDTAIGALVAAATNTALVAISLPNYTREQMITRFRGKSASLAIHKGNDLCKEARSQIKRYCDGDLTEFDLPHTLEFCTPFEQAVLRQVSAIPYGETRSYGDIARLAGYPRAFRAVGTANARNPLPLLVPCHRVVAANGLGGYGGGLSLKRKLLTLEQSKSLKLEPQKPIREE